jgi:hypothetical protein
MLGPPTDEPGDSTDTDEGGTSELPDEEADAKRREHRLLEVKKMNVKEKMMLASKANRIERAALLRDLNPSVARLLLRNPRIAETDVVRMAKDVSTPADVLEIIAKNRKWISNPEIRSAIVRNPRTPTPLALRNLTYLPTKDLSVLAKSQHVKDTVKREAFKLLTARREKGM